MDNSTPQKKPQPVRLISSRRKAKNSTSAGVTVFLVSYESKGNAEKAIHHFEVALEIASSFDWHDQLFRIYVSLAQLFSGKGRHDDLHAHAERAKSHAVNGPYNLALTSLLQAILWEEQHMFEEAKSEASHALESFENLGGD